ncbi:MAG: sigma-70 family RNA polymerase sigma factor [Thermoanaerobaculia bacterium]
MSELVAKVPFLKGPERLRSTRAARSHPRPAIPRADPASRGKVLLETHFELVCQKLQRLGRNSGLPEHEADEFRSWALFKLVENDYRILASWQGRSSFPTYLNVVLVNLMRDYRIHVWGKWRPSAAARSAGRESVLLEQLLVRDGLSLEEAIERVRTEPGVSLSQAELEGIAAKLPRRSRLRRVGEEEMRQIPINGQVESRLEDSERELIAAQLRELLLPILQSLPAEERRLLKLQYWDGLSMAAISPLLGRSQRELYRVRDRCLKKIRRHLEKADLNLDQVRALLGGGAQGYLGSEDI